MTTVPEIRELAEQPVLVQRAVTDAAGLARAIDGTLPALYGTLGRLGIAPTGPPFTRYLRTGQRFEIQLGVPVPASTGDLDGAKRASLPAGRAAVLGYRGPYEGLRDACEGLNAWVRRQGEQIAGPFWEVYVTDPRSEPDPSKRLTEIYLPIR